MCQALFSVSYLIFSVILSSRYYFAPFYRWGNWGTVCHSVHTLGHFVSGVRTSLVQVSALPFASRGQLITLSLALLISEMGIIIFSPRVVERYKRAYAHRMFTTAPISEQVLTMNKRWMSSLLRYTHFNISEVRMCPSLNGISQSPWTVAVVTWLSLPVQEQT